jgi:hypothetical protein
LCLGAFVAILSGLSGLGFSVQHLLFLTPDTWHLAPYTLRSLQHGVRKNPLRA